LNHERDTLDAVTRRLEADPQTVAAACAVLLPSRGGDGDGRRVIVSGIGKAGLIARKVAATMSSTGTAAVFVHPVEGLHGDLGLVRPADRGLLFSYSGETVELLRLARELSRLGCPLVAVTRSRDSSLGRIAESCIELGEIHEACYLGLAPSSSTTAMLAIGDALALAVAKATSFSAADFGRNHPAGTLGLRFRCVTEIMRTGARLVCVSPETPLREVVRRVSDAKTGAAVVVRADGTLVGIFTDGDLRRALLRGGDVLEAGVARFATVPCRFVADDTSVADALKVLQNQRIEDLPVVDQGTARVLGLVCLKDIAMF
jgi:arabinose-5-phosphate isomerase